MQVQLAHLDTHSHVQANIDFRYRYVCVTYVCVSRDSTASLRHPCAVIEMRVRVHQPRIERMRHRCQSMRHHERLGIAHKLWGTTTVGWVGIGTDSFFAWRAGNCIKCTSRRPASSAGHLNLCVCVCVWETD